MFWIKEKKKIEMPRSEQVKSSAWCLNCPQKALIQKLFLDIYLSLEAVFWGRLTIGICTMSQAHKASDDDEK